MPTLRSGDAPVRFRLSPGDVLSVSAPAGSSASVVHPIDFQPTAVVAGATQEFGPYGGAKTLTITCTAGAVNWADLTRPANAVVSSGAPDNSDGRPDGATAIVPGVGIFTKVAGSYVQAGGASLGGSFNAPSSGAGSIVSASYARWRAAKARVRGKTGFAKQACVGDSTEAGAYSLGNAVGVNGNRVVSHSVFMAFYLNSRDLPANSDNFVGDQGFKITNAVELGNYDPRISFTTGFLANVTTKTAGGSIISNSANTTGVLTFAPLLPVDTFDVYYATNAGLGSFGISRAGDASSPTVSQGGTSGVGKYTFTGALGVAPLNITPVAQGVYIVGIDAYNSQTPSVHVLNVGWSGGKTADWIDASTGFAPLNALKALACDLYLIRPGINEWNTSVPVATFQANLDTLVAGLLTVGDVALATPYPSQASAFSLALQKTYVDAIFSVATKYGLAVNDTWSKVGSWEQGNAFGFYANTLHPQRALYEKTAEADANFVLAL